MPDVSSVILCALCGEKKRPRENLWNSQSRDRRGTTEETEDHRGKIAGQSEDDPKTLKKKRTTASSLHDLSSVILCALCGEKKTPGPEPVEQLENRHGTAEETEDHRGEIACKAEDPPNQETGNE